MSTDERQQALGNWLEEKGYNRPALTAASNDASTRRYFRFQHRDGSLIAVDTPQPDAENKAFVDMEHALREAGLRTPRIYHSDIQNGWMVLEDFGSQTFANALTSLVDSTSLYAQASAITANIQNAASLQHLSDALPVYSPAMIQRELDIFTQWCLQGHLAVTLDDKDLADLKELHLVLVRAFTEQPQVFVHRDFHSRNLMLLDNGELGLIDFQGAVRGPMTYDWVSLLRDCYTTLPLDQVQLHLSSNYELALQSGICQTTFDDVYRWFDFTGLQRHLKAIGIFCRLKQLDKKPAYMKDIPRTFKYVQSVTETHTELASLSRLIKRHELEEKLC